MEIFLVVVIHYIITIHVSGKHIGKSRIISQKQQHSLKNDQLFDKWSNIALMVKTNITPAPTMQLTTNTVAITQHADLRAFCHYNILHVIMI